MPAVKNLFPYDFVREEILSDDVCATVFVIVWGGSPRYAPTGFLYR